MENNQVNIQNIIPNSPQKMPPTSKTHVKILYIICAVLLILFVLSGLYFFRNRHSTSITSNIQQQISPTPLNPTSQILEKFSHKSLPGFALNYPNEWKITTIKDFFDGNSNDFVSGSLKTCKENCMGVRFSKSDISLDFVFVSVNALELVVDNIDHKDSLICSNSVQSQAVGNRWDRLKDSKNYFYARSVEKNKTLKIEDIPLSFGAITDEWSALPDIEYSICVSGWGDWLSEKPKIIGSEAKDILPILIEFPTVKGNPDNTTLTEIDSIVSSIKGLQ